MFQSGNPTLKVFDKPQTVADFNALEGKSKTMTVSGTVNAAFILVGLCAASALATWMFLTNGGAPNPGLSIGVMFGGVVATLVLSLVISFGPKTAPFVAPVYALAEGAFVGSLSLVVATYIVGKGTGPETGIIFQAMLLTFGIVGSLLLGYKAGFIRVGSTMKRFMTAAVGGLCLCYIASIVLRLVNVPVPLFHEMFGWGKAGLIGIGFSAFMLVLASLFLVLDFQRIEAGAQAGAPKYMEWYGAYSLLVTIVWIYVEALRLLSKLKSND